MDINIGLQERSQAAKHAGESSAGPIRIDPNASAALEEAIKSAKLGLKPLPSPEVGTSERVATGDRTLSTKFLSQAAVGLLLIGAGWSASYLGTLANRDVIRQLETETARSQEILARLSADLGALKETVVAFKEVEHTSSTASVSEQTKLTDKVERLDDQPAGAGQEAYRPRRTARADGNPDPDDPRGAQHQSRRAERQACRSRCSHRASCPGRGRGSRGGSCAQAVKSEPVDGWVLREVYNGAALVENRNRRLYEVMPGGMLPGVGRIEGIERRGARWVVVTDKGFIGTYR